MGVTAAIMAGTSAVLAIGSAYTQSEAQKRQANFQQMQFDENAKVADVQAQDAKNRGDLSANQSAERTRKLIGSQRASAAGSGVDVSSGSLGSLESESEGLGALDQLTIKSNAWRESWGYQAQAGQARSSGDFAQLGGQNQSRNTLLTGGMQAVGYGANAAYYLNGRGTDSGKASSPGTPGN